MKEKKLKAIVKKFLFIERKEAAKAKGNYGRFIKE
jgi:stalled ribosome alternative rescue factor ArfA